MHAGPYDAEQQEPVDKSKSGSLFSLPCCLRRGFAAFVSHVTQARTGRARRRSTRSLLTASQAILSLFTWASFCVLSWLCRPATALPAAPAAEPCRGLYSTARSAASRSWLEATCAAHVLQLVDGTEYTWYLPQLEKVLQEAANQCECLQALLLRLPDGYAGAQEALFFLRCLHPLQCTGTRSAA